MNKLFLSNLTLVIGLNLLIKPLYIFGIDRNVQNVMGPGEYGLYFALFNFVFMLQFSNDFGIQNYNHSVFSKHDHLIPKYLPKVFATKLILGVIFLVAVFLFAMIIGFCEYLWPLLTLLACNQVILSGVQYLRTTASSSGQYRLDSLLSVVDKALLIVGFGYVFLTNDNPNISILDFVLAQTVSLALTLFIALVLLRAKGVIVAPSISFDKKFSLSLLRRSFPYAMVFLLMTLYTRMDGVMIKKLLPNGDEEAGIYAASYRILDAVSMVGVLFAGLLLPMFAKAIKSGIDLPRLVVISRNILLAVSLFVIVISFFYADSIISMLYPNSSKYWSEVFSILMLSYLGICLGYIYGTLLTASENMSLMNIIFLAGVVSNFALNWVLIPEYNALGAAWATLATQTMTAISLTLGSYKVHTLDTRWADWLKLLLLGGCLWCLASLMQDLTIPVLIQWLILGCSAILLFGLLRLWRSIPPGLMRY